MNKRHFLLLLCLHFACSNQSTSTVDSPNQPAAKSFQVRKMKFPNWVRSTSLYEVNIRQYTAEGTFRAFQEHLPRIKDLGIKTIRLLPVYPIGLDKRKGSLGSPKSIADFTKVNPELGSFEDLKSLISEIHRMHLHVVMDWISDHTAWDHTWVSTHPEWYVQQSDTIVHPRDAAGKPTDRYDVAELNYDVESMRHTMIESMKFWLRSIDVDGFVCHDTDLLPNDFWAEVRPALESVKPVMMIGQSEGDANHFETCFQANYNWSLYNLLNGIADGDKNVDAINQYLEDDRSLHPQGYYHINFTSTFDDYARITTRPREVNEALAAIAFTFEGMPMLRNGQEMGLTRTLQHYEKDAIEWRPNEKLEIFYKKLIHLKTHNKGLWNGVHGGKMERINEDPNVFAYLRSMDDNTVVTIVNCSNESRKTTLNRKVRSLTDLFTGTDYNLKEGQELSLKPWQYLVLSNPSILL